MKKFRNLKDIDTTIDEGKVLMATLGMLSTHGKYASKHPDEILRQMAKNAKEIYKNKGA